MTALSKQQQEVKNLRDRGLTYGEIGNALGISTRHVSVVVYNVRRKLMAGGGAWGPPAKAVPTRQPCSSMTALGDTIRACRQLGWQTSSIAYVLNRSVDEIHALEGRAEVRT